MIVNPSHFKRLGWAGRGVDPNEARMSDLPPLPVFAPRAPVTHQPSPIQMPGTDPLVFRSVIGGPQSTQDVRFVVGAKILDLLLKAAQASTTKRAIVYGCGFRISTYSEGGHFFQVLSLQGREPTPEVPAILAPDLGPEQKPDDRFWEPMLPKVMEGHRQHGELVVGDGHDLRLYISAEILTQMLDRAKVSRTGRAIIHRAGLVLDTYRPIDGDPYQVATILGSKPEPELPMETP